MIQSITSAVIPEVLPLYRYKIIRIDLVVVEIYSAKRALSGGFFLLISRILVSSFHKKREQNLEISQKKQQPIRPKLGATPLG